ncbi:MAG: hypothetical protein ABJO67_21320 [Pseudoruegeria sp.]
MFIKHSLLALVTFFALQNAVQAADTPIPEPFVEILNNRAKDCDRIEFGNLTVKDEAIQAVDLNGDGALDHVLNEHHLNCDTARSLYCGTGGCQISFLIGDTMDTRLAKGWKLVEFSPMSVVLLPIHGSECGGDNTTPCVQALVWDADKNAFSSIAPDPQ